MYAVAPLVRPTPQSPLSNLWLCLRLFTKYYWSFFGYGIRVIHQNK